ncbi:DUF4332 domain-containing protein [Aeoliella sp. ICT_H6.2]|uniref:DUF4332 domain-containing protein n=1 Tax=Aeoliella straminimaris TaxID=2954799 RepID=A0A9X2FH52_9BACT|nr:DUF4332 domain-containing protein [Aeoliella straminimaris]MCO6046549.1 DUF4332 domain-containing protein [Aeoliella straminimaris]
MKLQHLALGAINGATAQATLNLSEGLNAVSVLDSVTGEQLFDLVGHLVYGARIVRGIDPGSARTGYVDIASSLGRFRLERHAEQVDRGSFVEPRLSVAALDGHAARAETTRELLAGISPEVAARLFVMRSSSDAQLNWLLSEELAAELHELENRSPYEKSSAAPYQVGDDLFAERDALTHQIEMLLSDKRRSSEAMESALHELDRDSREAENQLAEQRRELDRVLAELAELETQFRYRELSDFVERETDEAHHAEQQPALLELDEQISKWRRTLAELEARDAAVRHRLSQLHPDDSSPLLPLADQRACVSIAQRLVADLDSEVARYARPTDSQACLCQHTHARLHPLVDTLGQQVAKLSHLVEQYEAAVEVEQLKSEAEHLARSQTALRGTIDQLLDRRQSRLRTSRVRRTDSEASQLPEDMQGLLAGLERRRGELNGKVVEAERHLADLATRRDRVRRDRAELLNDSSLTQLRERLESVNRRLEGGNEHSARSVRSVAPWRASDILAKLSDGRLREIRLSEHGRSTTVVNRQGNVVRQCDLNDVDRRLVCISLQLAAVAGTAEWGLELPLVVADPFAELPAAEASILTLVLHDWARSGHQVFLVTASRMVIDRLRSLGQPILGLETATQRPEVVQPVQRDEPKLTLHDADMFALDLQDSIGRFRVLGDDTSALFAEIGIDTLADLLAADAEQVSHSLDRTGISAEVVDLWQTHVAMMVYVPNLSLGEVQLLTGGGIQNLAQLAEADADELYAAIDQYLETPRGVRHRGLRPYLSLDAVQTWISDAQRYRHRWEGTPFALRTTRRAAANGSSSHRTRLNGRNGPSRRNGRSPANGKPHKKRTRPLKFRLSRTSPVVDAPSVGPKTAKRLGKLGIRTVADLLEADPAATAEALEVRHITAEKIVAWQHQAQLMCRVPELLVRDALVLVGCGFTTPEGIASADAADLYEFAKTYTATPEGTRALRGGDPPDLERANKWIYWAEHRRALEAA